MNLDLLNPTLQDDLLFLLEGTSSLDLDAEYLTNFSVSGEMSEEEPSVTINETEQEQK